MNPQIDDLYKQARLDAGYEKAFEATVQDVYQRFAQLIVQECIGVVEGGNFLHDQAPTAVFARECSGAIKRHFGVAE